MILFEETTMLSNEKHYHPRLYLEAIEIFKHKNFLNRKEEGLKINKTWYPAIENCKTKQCVTLKTWIQSTINQVTVYPTLANRMTAVSRSGYIRHLHSGPPSSLLRISKVTTSEQPVLKMSSTGDDEPLTSRCPGVGTRSGHTRHSRPWPSSPEVDNGINIAGRESLSQYKS